MYFCLGPDTRHLTPDTYLKDPTMRTILSIAAAMFAFTGATHADIFQWEYINPADPSQGKQQSTTLAPDGAGVDAVPRADLARRDLTMAYLIGADLTGAGGSFANLNNADLSQAKLNNADFTNGSFYVATLTGADFAGAEVRGASFNSTIGFTPAQLYSTASYQAHNLTGIHLSGDLSGWDFSGQNLTGASFNSATLTGADFSGAEVRGANFYGEYYANTSIYVGGITLAQLYSTSSYQAYDLSGISLWWHDLTGAHFAGQNLTNAKFVEATLTSADFTGALVKGADFWGATSLGFTASQLESTASYQAHDLSGFSAHSNDLSGWNFAGQNLTGANFSFTTLTGADFTGAEIQGASFNRLTLIFGDRIGTGITLGQLYSTASYQAQSLNGIDLGANDLAGGNFAEQNLTNARFAAADLTGANFREANLANVNFAANVCSHFGCGDVYAILTGADLTAVDARGAFDFYPLYYSGTTTTNLILADGHINGLDLEAGSRLVVRVYDGDPARSLDPIPITVDQHLVMATGGTLRFVFEADAWDSTISFAPGIPVTLGGTLELTFAEDVNLASQVGRTFDLFDWTGVTPTGAFAVSSPYAWNLANLYTTGEVTLTAIPEPAAIVLLLSITGPIIPVRRQAAPKPRPLTSAGSGE
jgi:uncharacterized protein YjbI with pentapeptide repeats